MARRRMDVRATKKGIRAKGMQTKKPKAKAKKGTSQKRAGFTSF
jgi:hypothetical protein